MNGDIGSVSVSMVSTISSSGGVKLCERSFFIQASFYKRSTHLYMSESSVYVDQQQNWKRQRNRR